MTNSFSRFCRTFCFPISLLIAVILSVGVVRGDDDAAALLADAKATLAAHRDSPAKPHEYAQCIYNLEKAQVLLENKGDTSSALAQEVNSTLFWAKRFSNIEISNEVLKLRGAGGAPKPVANPKSPAHPEKPAAPASPAGSVAEAANLAKAKAAYDNAERFAQSKSADPFAVSLRWFQVSSQFSGTEYAFKALEHARDAQARLAAATPADASASAKPADATAPVAGPAPDSRPSRLAQELEEIKADKPEFNLIRDADKLAADGKLEEAVAIYKQSILIHDTVPAERRLGHVHFKLAQKFGEELIPKYVAVDKEYNEAFQKAYELRGGNRFFNDRNPVWVAAQKKLNDLRKEADVVTLQAAAAQECFDKVIKLSPGNKDFDAAAFSAVSMSRRPTLKLTARSYVKEFLKNYSPADGTEQVTYEFCKSEYERLGK